MKVEKNFSLGSQKRALLIKEVESLGRTLWLLRDVITQQDRDWVVERINRMFEARLKQTAL